MADYVPPPGPPPPRVPEGWKAQWNDQYKEWFYVNLHTKQSQWERPTEPAYSAPDGGAPSGPPPNYDNNRNQSTGPGKGYGSNNPYASQQDDEAYARKLQEEENARVQAGTRGASDSYYSSSPQYGQQSQYGAQQSQYGAPQSQYGVQQQSQYGSELPPRDASTKSKGFLGKFLGKTSGSSSRPPQQQYMSQGQAGYGGYPQQQQQQGGYYGGQGGYAQQQQYAQPQKKKFGGLGAGGGAALGLGAGVLGGALLMDAMDDNHGGQGYDQGYDQGYENGNDDMGGGDMDGGDMGGGDF